MRSWPDAGYELVRELETHRGRLALVEQTPETGRVVSAFSELLGSPVNVGLVVTEEPLVTADEVVDRLVGAPLLVALDVLFWRPWLPLDPLKVLRRLARQRPPIVAVWPGSLTGHSLAYSASGRPDFFEAELEDVVVLRPIAVTFPDQVPYEEERR